MAFCVCNVTTYVTSYYWCVTTYVTSYYWCLTTYISDFCWVTTYVTSYYWWVTSAVEDQRHCRWKVNIQSILVEASTRAKIIVINRECTRVPPHDPTCETLASAWWSVLWQITSHFSFKRVTFLTNLSNRTYIPSVYTLHTRVCALGVAEISLQFNDLLAHLNSWILFSLTTCWRIWTREFSSV